MDADLSVLDPVRTIAMPHSQLPRDLVPADQTASLFLPAHGVRMLHRMPGLSGHTDLIRFSDDFFMLTSETRFEQDVTATCVTSGWVTFHYRISGRSCLFFDNGQVIEKEEAQCYVSCYPTKFVRTERAFSSDASYRYVALLLRPWVLANEFPTYSSFLPDPVRAHMEGRLNQYWQKPIPLTRDTLRCLHEVMSVGLSLELRWHFLRGKALELLCRSISMLCEEDIAADEPTDICIRPRDIERLNRARTIIGESPDQRQTIQSLAREVGLNRRKLTYGFSKLFGMTIFEFSQQVRMDEALRMLREDDLNIGQIAALLGYQNPRNFSAAFVKRFGLLPKDARARLRQGEDPACLRLSSGVQF